METSIRGDFETLWNRTQDPVMHQQWDLRFSEISYLPKEKPTDPQRFLYSTKIGFGINVFGIAFLFIYEGIVSFKFPMLFSGVAEVGEWYDDEAHKFKISVKVHNRVWGELFGYEGTFDVDYLPVRSKSDIPYDVFPKREEIRD